MFDNHRTGREEEGPYIVLSPMCAALLEACKSHSAIWRLMRKFQVKIISGGCRWITETIVQTGVCFQRRVFGFKFPAHRQDAVPSSSETEGSGSALLQRDLRDHRRT